MRGSMGRISRTLLGFYRNINAITHSDCLTSKRENLAGESTVSGTRRFIYASGYFVLSLKLRLG